MLRSIAILLGLPLLSALAAPVVAAMPQAPKPGEEYEETLRLGFRVRTPKSWRFTPPTPDAPRLIGTWWAPEDRRVFLTPELHMRPRVSLVAFDGAAVGSRDDVALAELGRWVDRGLLYEGHWFARAVHPFELREFPDARSIDFELRPPSGGEPLIRAWAALLPFREGSQLALIGTGPGDKKRWSKYVKSYESLARTVRRLVLEPQENVQPRDNSARELRRVALLNGIRLTPGWRLIEAPGFLILTSVEDDAFLDELAQRLAAARRLLEEDYPLDHAARLRTEAAERDARQPPAFENADPAKAERPPSTPRSAAELAKAMDAAVVRVCRDRDEYHRYGGWARSAGRFSVRHEELVLFDDLERGREHTWEVVQHELFHQYLYYAYGDLDAHPWFDEGTADYYGGFEHKSGKFKPAPMAARRAIIRSLLREDRFVPLRRLVRFTPIQYYGYSAFDTGPGDHYAQGWSLIWFLRGGAGTPKGWNPDWEDILDTYLGELARTRNRDWALYTAFRDVDWDELEASWRSYIE